MRMNLITKCARHLGGSGWRVTTSLQGSGQVSTLPWILPPNARYISCNYVTANSIKHVYQLHRHPLPSVTSARRELHVLPWKPSHPGITSQLHQLGFSPRMTGTKINPGVMSWHILRRAASGTEGNQEGPAASGKKITIPWRYVLLFCAVSGACGATLYAGKGLQELDKAVAEEHAHRPRREDSNDPLSLGAPFDLIDTSGKRRTTDDFIGQWILLYFGYTRCPEDCVEEVKKMVVAVNKVNSLPHSHLYEDVVPIFISIDPERDDLETIADFVKGFDSNLIGLTGSQEKIEKITTEFKVRYNRGAPDKNKKYEIDHSAALYLISPSGDCVDVYRHDDKTHVTDEPEHVECSIVAHIGKYIAKHEGKRLPGICINM